MTDEEKKQLVVAVITQLKSEGTDVSNADIVSNAVGIDYVVAYGKNGQIVRAVPTAISSEKVGATGYMNAYTEAGVYNINTLGGEDLPIDNQGAISARLTVLVTESDGNKVITQVLNLNNNAGGEGNVYIRSCQNGEWKAWGKLQTNIEVGQVNTLDHLTDNGIYSGVFTDGTPTSVGTFYDTFVLIVINNYAVSIPTGNPQSISQLKYSLGLDGSISVASRKRDQYGYWDDWASLDEKSLVEEEKSRAEQAEETIKNKAVEADSLNFQTRANEVAFDYKTIEGVGDEITIPAATNEKAGVMSAEDKKNLDSLNSSQTVTFTAQYQQKRLDRPIQIGAHITLSDNFTRLSGRTNSEDTDYLRIENGTITDRIINFVRNTEEMGECIISDSIYNYIADVEKKVDTNVDDTEELTSRVNIAESNITTFNKELLATINVEVYFLAQYSKVKLPMTLPSGWKVTLPEGYRINGRTNEEDSTYQVITNGTVLDRDVNFATSSNVEGECVIIAKGSTIRNDVENIRNDVENIKDDIHIIHKNVNGTFQQTELEFTWDYQMLQLPFTISKGASITVSGDFDKISCRTASSDSTYQVITSSGIADRDINYVKNTEIPGKVVLTAYTDGIVQKVEEIDSRVTLLENAEDGAAIKSAVSVFKQNLVRKRIFTPLKLLAVGNSWSSNATNYLPMIMESLGLDIEIGVSYAGGTNLQYYWNAIGDNTERFELFHYKNGSWDKPRTLHTYKDIVTADQWDIVTHQQKSTDAGVYSTYQPYLHNIIEWESKQFQLRPKFVMHATWTYADGTVSDAFNNNYGGSSQTMYNSVMDAYNQAMADEGITSVMPSLLIIQRLREMGISDIDTADGTHLSITGQFAVALVWAEMLIKYYYANDKVSGLSVINSTYKPDSLDNNTAETIRQLAVEIVNSVNNYFPLNKTL